MYIIRPIASRDLEQVLKLSKKIGYGFTSVLPEKKFIVYKIQVSQNSFNNKISNSKKYYWFVLESVKLKKIVGWSAIEACLGGDHPSLIFEKFKRDVSHELLNTNYSTEYLRKTDKFDNYTAICSLFLDPAYRGYHLGKFLSLFRLLFIGVNSKKFSKVILAEMRGISDSNGFSPFWWSLMGKHINLSFYQVDSYRSLYGFDSIKDLLPFYPVKINNLSAAAQRVISKIHPDSEPASNLLTKQGFFVTDFIDICDAGAVLAAAVNKIKINKNKLKLRAKILENPPAGQYKKNNFIICNNKINSDFRAIQVEAFYNNSHIILNAKQAKSLKLQTNNTVYISKL